MAATKRTSASPLTRHVILKVAVPLIISNVTTPLIGTGVALRYWHGRGNTPTHWTVQRLLEPA